MEVTESDVRLSLPHDHALVLFEFLARMDSDDCEGSFSPAELRVIWDLQAGLERELVEPLRGDDEE